MSLQGESAKLGYLVWRFRDLYRCIPRHPFDEEAKSPQPDYEASLELWSAHPLRGPGARSIEDANWLSAPGVGLRPPPERPCDCFFVHDTCCNPAELMPFLGDCAPRWNAPLGADAGSSEGQLAAKINEQVDLRVAAAASCFSSFCRVYAPRYRQVAVTSFFHTLITRAPLPQNRGAGRRALDLAYDDVRRAFLRVVDDPANAGRPFILAGHSQGSHHLLRLLQEVERRPDLLDRFVHAYLAGHVVPLDVFGGNLRAIRPSTRPDDLCTISSWRTGRKGLTLRVRSVFSAMKFVYYADSDRYRYSRARVLATNPVTWTSNFPQRSGEPSRPEHYRGAAWPLPENMDPRDHAGVASSGVNSRFGHLVAGSRGTLGAVVRKLSTPDVGDLGEFRVRVDRLGTTLVPALPSGSLFALMERDWLYYHDIDFAVFHSNVRENAELRYQRWARDSLHRDGPRSRL
mmetsp:Transcript_102003/g.304327  ORF Transcript_102003/g.304327 Transcript_102003/m.304327 type:complete len:459 (-) Transcript_102003:37-1413(-)